MEWNDISYRWKSLADNYGFKPITKENLNIYTTKESTGIYSAYFIDPEDMRRCQLRCTDDTAFRILEDCMDEEKLIAIYLCASIHNIFEGRNKPPRFFEGREVYEFVREIKGACRDKLEYSPLYHHWCSEVWPVTLNYRAFTCYWDRNMEYFDPDTIYTISILEAMLNSKFAISFSMNIETLKKLWERRE